MTNSPLESQFVTVNGIRLHYQACGEGHPVLFLHGWPTSSHLWRNILPEVGQNRRAIALDLPGFGWSDKPLDKSYSLYFYESMINGFLEVLGINETDLVVHDLGGPVGLFWAVNHPQRVTKLVLLNTLVYPELSWAAKAFVISTMVPGIRHWLSSTAGLKWAMKLGVVNKQHLTTEVLRGYQDPFRNKASRQALCKTVHRISFKGLAHIENQLTRLEVPVQIIYGENDRILPDVAQTMSRVKQQLPHAHVNALPACGHFLQEDDPQRLGAMISKFLRS